MEHACRRAVPRCAGSAFCVLCAREMGASHDGSNSHADYFCYCCRCRRVGSHRRCPSLLCWYFGPKICLLICFTSHLSPPIPIVSSEACCPPETAMPKTMQVKNLPGGVTEPPRLARGRGKGACPHRGQRHRRCPCPADSDPTHRLVRTATRVCYLLHRCRMLKCIYMKACRYISQVYPGISQVYQFWKQPPRTCEGHPSISYVHQVLVPWQRVAHIYPKRPTVYHA